MLVLRDLLLRGFVGRMLLRSGAALSPDHLYSDRKECSWNKQEMAFWMKGMLDWLNRRRKQKQTRDQIYIGYYLPRGVYVPIILELQRFTHQGDAPKISY